MGSIAIDDARLKGLLKQAMTEVLEERADLFRALLAEVVEDLALARAIKEEEHTPVVGKNEVLRALE